MLPISDKTIDAIEYAMRALEMRSRVTAHNVANAQVPDFRASRVSFESELARALEGRRGVDRVGSPTVVAALGEPDATGNDVNIEEEVVDMIQTNLYEQAMVEAFNFKTGVLRTAIRGQ